MNVEGFKVETIPITYYKNTSLEKAIDLPNGERNLGKERLCEVLKAKNVQSEPAENIVDALEKAKAECGKEDVVLVFGSLSYLGEVIRLERETNVFGRKKEERTLW